MSPTIIMSHKNTIRTWNSIWFCPFPVLVVVVLLKGVDMISLAIQILVKIQEK